MQKSDYRLLIADDNEDNRYILVRWLRRRGYSNLCQVENGSRALEVLRAEAFDLVLLDIMMPGLTGIEVLQTMKTDPRLRSIPVIMVSALDELDSVVRCIELGADDYLTKPLNHTILGARVGACLEKKRLVDVERAYLRHHDALTGLPNRTLFVQRVDEELQHVHQSPHPFALLRVNLERFKAIAESLGRHAGDEILVHQAERLERKLHPGDLLAHFGAGEFGLLMADAERVSEVLSYAMTLQKALAEPLSVHDHRLVVPGSIGITIDNGSYKRAEGMLRDAGLAARRVRDSGLGGCELFNEAMHHRALSDLKLEADLRWALEAQELALYYQPIIAMHGGAIAGFEALLRWRHPRKGLLSPALFVPILEASGLIVPVGAWILHTACRQVAAWRQRYPAAADLWIGVNVSYRQLAEPDFVALVRRALAETGLPSTALDLEITESVAIANPERAVRLMAELAAAGIRWSIDDFGTGYSSLNQLHRLPLDILKIDRSFVNRLSVERKHFEIVRSLVVLAHNLDLDVVAEGVEFADDLAILQELGCDFCQGFLLSKPVDGEAAEALLAPPPSWSGLFGEPPHPLPLAGGSGD